MAEVTERKPLFWFFAGTKVAFLEITKLKRKTWIEASMKSGGLKDKNLKKIHLLQKMW